MPLGGIVLSLFKRQVDSATMLSSPLAFVCLHETHNSRTIIVKYFLYTPNSSLTTSNNSKQIPSFAACYLYIIFLEKAQQRLK